MLKKSLLAVMICLFSAVAFAQYPYQYSRSLTTKSGTTYYGRNGSVIGRSYSTPYSTYYTNRYGRTVGRQYTSPTGNSYFFRTNSNYKSMYGGYNSIYSNKK